MPCCPPAATTSTTPAVPATAEPKVHLHLSAADHAAAVAFYRAFLGSEPVKLLPGYAKFLPAWAPLNLAISAHATARGGALSHLGVQVGSPSILREQLARVRAAGLPVRVEMGVDCCHANQDKFWVGAPDGVEWEVYHLNHDLVPAAGASCHADTTGCCG
jgi:catechol 2,3-dioxygenase-like lactoylglutathione lyase family enzyme